MEASALSTLLTNLSTIITKLIADAGAIFMLIEEHPIAFVGIAISIMFVLVRFVKSILSF